MTSENIGSAASLQRPTKSQHGTAAKAKQIIYNTVTHNMEQTEFLEKNIFTDLKNLNDGFDNETIQYFSESDFEIVLQRVEHFGIGVYGIEPWLNGEFYSVAAHEDFKKKATDPRWYKKAFLTFKSRQSGLSYSATYKVSTKLLSR